MTSACALALLATLAAPGADAAPSFLHDVEPIFTRYGCNQGACHGKSAGQNGFRLSLRGYAPDWDHAWLTREAAARRINPAVPEASLLLQKALGQVPHEGGKLFGEGAPAHRALLDWLRAGAPGPRKDEPALRQVTVTPAGQTCRPGMSFQLTVRAEYDGGATRDVTWLARFDSGDAAVAEVDAAGRVGVKREGETTVRASFQGHVAVTLVTVPFDRPTPLAAYATRANVVDEHVFNKLAALRIEPSGPCDDAVFHRRVALDLTGTLPTPDAVRAFLADPRPDRRARLVDRLLESPEFVDFWTLQLGDLFQNRVESDHDVRGVKGVRSFHAWLREQVARNRPWDELVREVLTATGSVAESPAVGYFIVTVGERQAHESEVGAAVAQALLGTRIGCAKCHNHPAEKYTQDDYYHFAAFFSRLKLERRESKQGPTKLLVTHPDANQNKNPVGVRQPRTGAFLTPRPLDRSEVPVRPGDDPRVPLAKWLTDPANPYFAGALVNRLWRHFFAVGLVEPVDDLRASNPPSNPELWRALCREFTDRRFDVRHLMRLLVNARAYQLSSATTPSNATDARFHSHYYARRLPAEVLLDALSDATGVPDTFPGYPKGLRAVQLPDPGLKSYFLSLFGRSERITACACERNGEVTMPQLLHLQNGDSVVDKVRAGDGRLARLLREGGSDVAVVDGLFLATLSRLPTVAERSAVGRELAAGPREEVFRDLFWALLNAREFGFNH